MSVRFYEVEPSESLSLIIDNYFVIEYDEDDRRVDFLLPNGTPSFFFLQAEEGFETCFFDSDEPVTLSEGVYIGYGKNLMEYAHRRIRIIGASVYPIFFSFMFHKPLGHLMNRFVLLESIPEFASLTWPEQLWGMETLEIVQMLEAFLTDRVEECDFSEELVEAYHKVTEPKGYMSSVEDLAKWLGYSTRYMSKLFNKHLGMSPKQFLKIVRFNQALKLMSEMGEEKTLAHVAYEIGYHDQAHFIRDFKSICGRTPRELTIKSDSLAHKFRLFKSD